MKINPKIYLAIDNCFASKRWTRPCDWVPLIQSMGIRYVEASADNECDPLYSESSYLETWIQDVKEQCRRHGVTIANLYSGHGTYATLGLGHTDLRVRKRMLNQWLKPMVLTASRLQAGLGFFCHAFPEIVLQSPQMYAETKKWLYESLAEIACYGAKAGIPTLGVEQMYSPHQIPWTLHGAKELMREVYAFGQKPFYITIDTGHQSGQKRFLRPTTDHIRQWIDQARSTHTIRHCWLGPHTAYRAFEQLVNSSLPLEDICRQLLVECDRFPYLFAEENDGDPYRWLEQFGCYSPIIHLQQTDGHSSSHLPFDETHNRHGLIKADRLLGALAQAYEQQQDPLLPPPCESIFLTIEVFSGTSEFSYDILTKVQASIAYWRQFIPTDGMTLQDVCRPACDGTSNHDSTLPTRSSLASTINLLTSFGNP